MHFAFVIAKATTEYTIGRSLAIRRPSGLWWDSRDDIAWFRASHGHQSDMDAIAGSTLSPSKVQLSNTLSYSSPPKDGPNSAT